MTAQVTALLSPFVKRGLFDSPETAVATLARDYTLQKIARHQAVIEHLQKKYGMSYAQFEAYLAARSSTLAAASSLQLSQALMEEEDDALDWKIAQDMLTQWLGLQSEVTG